MSLYLGDNLISGNAITVDKSERIGQIIQSTIPLTDAGLHLLDGTLIQSGGIYDDFVSYIAQLYAVDPTANYFCSESDWQADVLANGVCGKFVYDSVNNTVRLPKYNSKIYTGGGTVPVKGNGKTLGLTNGIVDVGLQNYYGGYSDYSFHSSVYDSDVGTASVVSPRFQTNKTLGVTTDGTKSGIIADFSNITTALDGYWYIVIATSTKTQIEVDIDEIATDLNGKADVDLSNVSNTSGFRKLVEVYNNGSSWYKVFRECDASTGNYIGLWCEQGGKADGTTLGTVGTVNTINLLVDFANANYSVLMNGQNRLAGDASYYTLTLSTDKFTFTWGAYGSSSKCDYVVWRASGYIS